MECKEFRIEENRPLTEKVHFDMQLPFSHADERLACDLQALEPFGVGNPKPLFAARDVTLRNINVYGKSRNVVKCVATDGYGTSCDAVYFGDAEGFTGFLRDRGKLKILYSPEINEYRGRCSLQLRIQDYC